MDARIALLVAAMAAVGLAGCIDSSEPPQSNGDSNDPTQSGGGDQVSGTPPPGTPADHQSPEDIQQRGNHTFDDDYPVFCDEDQQSTENGGDCRFYDEMFHQYTLYNVDTTKLDIIIVPPASPELQRDTATMRLAAEAWRDGIYELGADWFLDRFEINVYTAGEDDIPDEARNDPEIIVLGVEVNPVLLLGIGLEPYQFATGNDTPCLNGAAAEHVYPVHEHSGARILAADCEQTGFTCVAANTNFLFGGAMSMFDLVTHEIGHCLGTGHVGDAGDFSAKRVPIEDIMSYQSNDEQVHCVSNMNVLNLEGLYAHLYDEVPQSVGRFAAGDFMLFHPSDYAQVECDNPPTSGLIS